MDEHQFSATKIQKFMRNVYGRRQVALQLRCDVDSVLSRFEVSPLSAKDVFVAGKKLLFIFSPEKDKRRFVNFCKVILNGMESKDMKVWYVTLALDKSLAVEWMKHTKKLLGLACCGIKAAEVVGATEFAATDTFLSLILTLCDYSLWKLTTKAGVSLKPLLHQLCVTFTNYLLEKDFYPTMNQLLLNRSSSNAPCLSTSSLSAAMGIRLLALKGFSSDILVPFIRFILSVPASMHHLHNLSQQVTQLLQEIDFFMQLMKVFSNVRICIDGLDTNSVAAITCNVLYLASLEGDRLLEKGKKRNFLFIMLELLHAIQSNGMSSKGNSFWHPLFGWCSGAVDKRFVVAFTKVQQQLQQLWHPAFLDVIFSEVLKESSGNISRKLRKEDSALFTLTSVCEMYLHFISIMKNHTLDILIGLGCNEIVVLKIWCFFKDATALDVKEVLRVKMHTTILSLFSQMMLYMLIILDDSDLFETQRSFKSSDFAEITMFLNNCIFHAIWMEEDLAQLSHCRELLSLLYYRDCKQHFCHKEHWHIRGVKVGQLIKELHSKTHRSLKILAQLPHVYPFYKRIEVFYQRIQMEKQTQGYSVTYISVRRDKLLKDGYHQLGLLSNTALKGTIKVKFVNAQGLDEAGIDETGVFKEFLEETLKLAFNPAINLFKTNAEGHLFPSSSSASKENHLELFQFLGKMLGKAVHEGIVVDIPLAPFFLGHLLRQTHSAYYNYLNELAVFDQQMYSSLNYIKHYDGDFADLCLTFSVDEEIFGKTKTYELIVGGSTTPVTSSNRLSYIHQMALFKLSTQIKEQINSFVSGFHSLVEPSLIQCFSSLELQKLISGDETDVDVDDLRKNTEYLGGYHSNHRVVLWLWDILKNHFNATERGKFLKFVTSCSRPPLLGFKELHPPFTVRCVQITYSEDVDDSFRTIIRGMFSRRPPNDRLPSSSTCFNLLKLPNYSKKSILKEKLKYAIEANCGFELS